MKGLCQKIRKKEESFSKEMRLFFCGSFAKATSVAVEEIESDVSIRFLLKGGKFPSDIVRLRRKCVFYYYFS